MCDQWVECLAHRALGIAPLPDSAGSIKTCERLGSAARSCGRFLCGFSEFWQSTSSPPHRAEHPRRFLSYSLVEVVQVGVFPDGYPPIAEARCCGNLCQRT